MLSAAMVKQMLTPGMNHQGLGPQTGGSADHPYFTHGGANEGYRCNLVAYNNGDGVAIMTNGDNGGQLAFEIQRTVAHEYGWPDFQPAERTIATVDPKILDAYPGVYKSSNGAFTVTRGGDQLFIQLAGQPKLPVFPESERKFFGKVVDAEFTFDVDAQGKPAQLTLHQNGMEIVAKRLDDAEAKRTSDEAAARAELTAKRFKEQKPAPGSEAALRRVFEEVRAGQPDYSRMSPGFADVTRRQLPDLKSTVAQLGAIQSVTFKGVGPGGADIYEVKFENGSVECRIGLTPDGKIDGMGFRPM